MELLTPTYPTDKKLRIISGWAKGRKLHTPPKKQAQTIRPTSDRAREALFSILTPHIDGATVIDLYAGTGAFGIEALSRGASHVTFVDNTTISLNLVKKNLELCFESLLKSHSPPPFKTNLYKIDLSHNRCFKKHSNLSLENFDIIFLDPPYSKGLAKHTLQEIDSYNNLKHDVLIVAEERFNEEVPNEFKTLTLADNRKYGEASFWFYKIKS